LRETAAARGVGRVHFVGPLRGAGKMTALERADVFVLPSYAEGLPYALLESMAAGVRVMATRVGAIPELVEDGINGVLVEPRSAVGLAGAVGTEGRDPEPHVAQGDRQGYADQTDCELNYHAERAPPRWNHDPKTGVQAPLTAGKLLNYRDRRLVRDIKYLYHLNRHLHLLTPGQD